MSPLSAYAADRSQGSEGRRDESDDNAFTEYREIHLGTCHADRSKQRELSRPLREQHAERGEDDAAADEKRKEGKGQQDPVSELERRAKFASCALSYSAVVITDVPSSGTICLIRFRNVSDDTSCAATTSIRSHLSPMPVSRCAHASSMNTAPAPVRSPPVRGLTKPTIRPGYAALAHRHSDRVTDAQTRVACGRGGDHDLAVGARRAPAVRTNGKRVLDSIQL